MRTVQDLEKEITHVENVSGSQLGQQNNDCLLSKRQELNHFLHERAKGALVRARFTRLQDMDAPTTFFFNLGKSVVRRKQMMCLQLSDGKVTTDPAEMRRHAVAFYTDLFSADGCDVDSASDLLQGLPQLSPGDRDVLNRDITLDELSAVVSQMASGTAPGIDGLPSDFFKHFWSLLGRDLLDVFKECFLGGILPASCRRAVISLIPKKGDLTLLKNWRPVALLCADYKILSKVLSNRLKMVIELLIGVDQSYCIPDRSMIDNLFLMRDVFDICKVYNAKVGIVSIDQEKAFDRVDHDFLFSTLKTFGVGRGFLTWVKLLYSDACCVVKVGGGLSCPVPVRRGIRQGCPISGQLYSIAIEPFLCRLRSKLRGFSLPDLVQSPPVVVSAYADDVNVFITDQKDVQELQECLVLYGNASSARVNWDKSEACLVGQWDLSSIPKLPGNLRWGKRGINTLGVYLGSDDLVKQNWEGVREKVEAKLSKWNRLLPYLSYRGRVLVANNLVASSLWHRLLVLVPPPGLLEEVQRLLVKFVWSGQHWLRAAGLYLPVAEGGQGLIDVLSRTATFRLQTAQRLLYGCGHSWMFSAQLLLRRAGRLGLDKHLFLLMLDQVDLSGLVPFYSSVVNAWRTLKVARTPEPRPGMWLFEEPLFFNDFFPSTVFSSATIRTKFVEAGVVKLGHLTRMSMGALGGVTGIKSYRVLERIMEEVWQSLSPSLRDFAGDRVLADQWADDSEYVFPSLMVSPVFEEQPKGSGMLLSLGTPVLNSFSSCGKKQLYLCCVKVLNFRSLVGIRESKWTGFFASDSTPKGRWRVLYKPPVERRMADLQWRIVHGAIATNRHRAHLDPSIGEGCPFCSERETLEHLVVCCPRLVGLFSLLQEWVESLGVTFSVPLFVFGPKYSVQKRRTLVLINFLFGTAKLAIWKTRKNQMLGQGWTDVVQSLKGLLASRLKVEHAFYSLTSSLDSFETMWGIGRVLCSVGADGTLILHF
uniref:Reverse transcriptase domain-containing protein n=1 Tax=Oreochromis niloticus TaxID=8128 RepID=A0A669D6D2_ORENI